MDVLTWSLPYAFNSRSLLLYYIRRSLWRIDGYLLSQDVRPYVKFITTLTHERRRCTLYVNIEAINDVFDVRKPVRIYR